MDKRLSDDDRDVPCTRVGVDHHKAAGTVTRLTPGTKLDTGKPPVRLILHTMPRALLELARVADYGNRGVGYAEDGWLEVPDGINRYTDALGRHFIGEGIEAEDPHSKRLHAAHVAWNAMARLELMLREDEE